MQTYRFTKMHGAGNDYIFFSCFDQEIEHPIGLAKQISHRNFGIGGDGIVLICPSVHADAQMRMFNMDGSEGEMCGNAIRCVAKYVYDNDICKKPLIKIQTLAGIKDVQVFTDENDEVTSAKVAMGKADFTAKNVPVLLDMEEVIDETLPIAGREYAITCVSMGNPHCVVFLDEIDSLDLRSIGPLFEHNEIFPERINTEFIRIIDKNNLQMRVWERGSGETMACGTGACAAVGAAVANGHCNAGEDVQVHLPGGILTINYTPEQVYMTGPAEKVFEGVISI